MKSSPKSGVPSKPRPRLAVISSIADIFKIWKTGRLYMLPGLEKEKAKQLVMTELENKTLTPSQLKTMETLRNVLEG